MKTVAVKFVSFDTYNSPKTYNYFIRPGDDPKVGDFIVTSIVQELSGKPKLNVARIESIGQSDKATKMYLFHISVPLLEQIKAENDAVLAKHQRKLEITQQLDKRLEDRNKFDLYRELAVRDPEAAAMLHEIERL